MSLKDSLQSPPPPNVSRSRIDVWLETQSEEDAEALRKAATDSRWTNPALCAALAEHGLEIGESAMLSWRRKQRS